MHQLPSALVVLIAMTGCAVEGVVTSGSNGESAIEIGTGETSFSPLDDDAALDVVLGAQGGYHVVGNLRVWGEGSVEGHALRFWLQDESGPTLSIENQSFEAACQPHEDGALVLAAGHHVLLTMPPTGIDGMNAIFGVEMIGEDGEPVSDVRRVTLRGGL